MHPDDLFSAVRRRPFLPFRLYVSDGSTYEIRHPDIILVGRHAAVVAVPPDPDRPAERFATIALLHITRLDDLDGASVER